MKQIRLVALMLVLFLALDKVAPNTEQKLTNEDLYNYCYGDFTEISDFNHQDPHFFKSTEHNYYGGKTNTYDIRQTPDPFETCPGICDCYIDHDGLTVNCSDRNLTNVPQLPLASNRVFLQRNDISEFPCGDFASLKYLRSLDLSENPVQKFHSCSFQNLTALQNLDLSETNLTDIPSTLLNPLNYLQKLNISNNNLTDMSKQTLKNLANLTVLDVSKNRLWRIRNGTFEHLRSLVCLFLNSNQLRYKSSSSFEKNAFEGLPSLKALHLHDNQHDFPRNFTYPDQTFHSIPNLQILSLDGHPQSLGLGFGSLTFLTSLSFSEVGSTCNMQLTKMPEKFFLNINTSQPLDISLNNCNISFLPPDIFNFTPTIHKLDLDNNVYLHLEGFEKGSRGLRGSNLTYLSISNIVDERFEWRGAEITNTTFKNLQGTKLTSLTVAHNYIESVHITSLAYIRSTLLYLSLFDNKLPSYFILQHFAILRNLRVLQLSRQNIHLKTNSLREVTATRGLNQYQNETKGPGGAVPVIRDTNSMCDGKPTPSTIVFPMRLEELYINDAKGDSFNYPQLTVVNNKVLRVYEYSHNDVRCFAGAVTGLQSVKRMDLSRNAIFSVTGKTFTKFPKLETLLLAENILGQCLADDIRGIIFSKLFNLERLDLHGNAIKDLARTAFSLNAKLRILDLSGNQLSQFNPSLSNNTKLEELDLSINTLTGLSVSTCEELKAIKKLSPKFQMKIANNRFLCDCSNLQFLILLAENPGRMFSDIESFTCLLDNGNILDYSMLEEYLPSLSLHCVSERLFDIVFTMFNLVMMALGVLSTYYYKRWQWRYLHYLGRSRLHIGATHITRERKSRAFVTYNEEDTLCRWLMMHTFQPKLEQLGISIILGEDFAGKPIYSSVASAVTNTHKTVVFIRKDMFEDPYLEFGFNLAIMHELHMRKPVLVPVILLNTGEVELVDLEGNSGGNGIQATDQPNDEHSSDLAIDLRGAVFEPWMESLSPIGLESLSDSELTMFDEMLASFPPEISVYLHDQSHRCIVYDGGSREFWTSLEYALLEEFYR